MDLRHYIKKKVIPERVLHYEYRYYSHIAGKGSPAGLYIAFANEDNLDNDFSVHFIIGLNLDIKGRILSSRRLEGYLLDFYYVDRFPSVIEDKAEQFLNDITDSDKNNQVAVNLDLLKDEYGEWERVKNKVNHRIYTIDDIQKWIKGEQELLFPEILSAIQNSKGPLSSESAFMILKKVYESIELNPCAWMSLSNVVAKVFEKGFLCDSKIQDILIKIKYFYEHDFQKNGLYHRNSDIDLSERINDILEKE